MLKSLEYYSEKKYYTKFVIELCSNNPLSDKDVLLLKNEIEANNHSVSDFYKISSNHVHGININYDSPKPSPADERWIKDLIRIVDQQLDNGVFDLDSILKEIQMRRTLFYNKVKKILKTTPNNLFLAIKFSKASFLLKTGKYKKINEVSKAVGFKDVNYFIREFKKRTGFTPSELLA